MRSILLGFGKWGERAGQEGEKKFRRMRKEYYRGGGKFGEKEETEGGNRGRKNV